jgi:hypothetical protein
MPSERGAHNAFTDYCGGSQNATTLRGRLAYSRRLALSGPIAGKIAPPQDISELCGQLSGPPPWRENQMQVSQQGRCINGKFDEKVVADEGFGGRNKATRYDPSLRG